MTRTLIVLFVLVIGGVATAEQAKKPKRAFIGVQIREGKEAGQILVMGVFDGSPAEKAGLKVGDVILEIDGAKPQDLRTAVKVIAAQQIGKKLTVKILREGKEKKLTVVPRAFDE